MFLNIAMSKSDLAAFGDLLYGLIISVVVSNSIVDFMIIMFYTAIATVFTICISIIVRSLAIWFGEVESIAHVYEQSLFTTLSTYPEAVFKGGIKILMYTIIPAMYAVHLPIKLLGKFSIKIFMMIIAAMLVYLIFAKLLFREVIKRYESGNSITLKN